MLGEVAQAAHLKDKGQDIEVVSGREFVDLLPGWESAPHDDAAPWLTPGAPLLASSATATPAARPPRNPTDQTSAQSGLM